MQRVGLTDVALRKAVSEMAQGLIDADLGGHVVKKRLALPGQGKQGGARTLVATSCRIAGSFCMDSTRMNGTTWTGTN